MNRIKIYDMPPVPLSSLLAALDAGELDATLTALGSAGGAGTLLFPQKGHLPSPPFP